MMLSHGGVKCVELESNLGGVNGTHTEWAVHIGFMLEQWEAPPPPFGHLPQRAGGGRKYEAVISPSAERGEVPKGRRGCFRNVEISPQHKIIRHCDG
jgi:hypothetical protein